jgi:sugar phosphate isomerase/epimerase
MSKPTLKHFASLWTLMDYPNGSASGEWPMEKKVAAIKEAGFAGFQSGALPELKDLAEKYELACLGGCQANAGNYSQTLWDFVPMNTVRINVQLGNHAMQPEEAVDLWIAMNKEAADLGLTLDLETHRDTCTETPEKTWKIAELYAQKNRGGATLEFRLLAFRSRQASLPALCRPSA